LADGTPALTTDGAPSDCVALAILGIVDESIDMVISGINPLANLGHDVTYSGTVTAAMEATISGLTGMAISLDSAQGHEGDLDYMPAAVVTLRLVSQIASQNLPDGVLLNVNIPNRELEDIAGVMITEQGQSMYREALVRRVDPRGRTYYWIGGGSRTGSLEPGTDLWALTEGYVSITPLQLNLTAHSHLHTLKNWELSV
jgi:5'-nucleotidase